MASAVVVILVLSSISSIAFAREVEFQSTSEHHGWGEVFTWVPLKKAWNMSRDDGKPMMVIFHKQYCAPCVGLKPMLQGSEDIKVLSQNFIMVNCKEKDEENPVYRPDRGAGGTYTPDGDYTPRIFFYDADGNRMDDILNEYGNRAFKYYYPPAEVMLRALVRSMKTVQDITANGRRIKEIDKDEL